SVKGYRKHLPHTRKLATHEPGGSRANMALHTLHSRMRRALVRREFRLHHRMAGLPAEALGFHVRDGAVCQLAADHQVYECRRRHEYDEAAEFCISQIQRWESRRIQSGTLFALTSQEYARGN